MPVPGKPQSPIDQLPFDPVTVVLGLIGRWRILVLALPVAAAVGIVGGIAFGKRSYRAETSLLYRPVAEEGGTASYQPPSLPTQMHMVKMESNVAEVRRRLELESSLGRLGGACDVHVQRDTTLMVISVTWDDAKQAAEIANAYREVFIEMQGGLRRRETQKQLDDLQQRLGDVSAQLKLADDALHAFASSNRVVDIDKEAQWYLEELTSVDVLAEQAELERQAVELQAENLHKIVAELKAKAAQESEAASKLEALSNVSLRLQRLRDNIHDDRTFRSNQKILAEKQLAYERAKRLHSKGLISGLDLDKARLEFESQQALGDDTPEIAQWKKEMAELDTVMLPSGSGSSPAGVMLQEMMMKDFDIQLQRISLSTKAEHLKSVRERLSQKLDGIPTLRREFVKLSRDVVTNETEKKSLEQLIAQARRALEAEGAEFSLVAEAQPPTLPAKSNRRMIAVGLAFLVLMAAVAVCVLLELLEPRIRSPREMAQHRAVPFLGALPRVNGAPPGNFAETPLDWSEPVRRIARQVRRQFPDKGARLMVLGVDHGAGATTVATNVAAALNQDGHSVLLVDAQFRSRDGLQTSYASSEKSLNQENWPLRSGSRASLAETVVPTTIGTVDCLPQSGTPGTAATFSAQRLADVLNQAAAVYDVVIVEGPPIHPYADAELMAEMAQAVLIVVGAHRTRKSITKKAFARLVPHKTPVAGSVLNRVDPLFML